MRAADSPLSSVSTQPSIVNSLRVWWDVQTALQQESPVRTVARTPSLPQRKKKRVVWILCATLILALLGITMAVIAAMTVGSSRSTNSDVEGTSFPTEASNTITTTTKPPMTSTSLGSPATTTSVPTTNAIPLATNPQEAYSVASQDNESFLTIAPEPTNPAQSEKPTPIPAENEVGTLIYPHKLSKKVVAEMNYLRSAHGMPGLIWSTEIENEMMQLAEPPICMDHRAVVVDDENRTHTLSISSTFVLDWYLLGIDHWNYTNDSCTSIEYVDVCMQFQSFLRSDVIAGACVQTLCSSQEATWCLFKTLEHFLNFSEPSENLTSILQGFYSFSKSNTSATSEPTITFPDDES